MRHEQAAASLMAGPRRGHICPQAVCRPVLPSPHFCGFAAVGGLATEVNLHRVVAGDDPLWLPCFRSALVTRGVLSSPWWRWLWQAGFSLPTLGNPIHAVSHGIWTVVGLLAAANALRSTLRAVSIESEHIYAALSAYLLAGLSFGVLYWALERAWPGSLNYGGGMVNNFFSEADGIYFSFVTLATLGYGDFVPKTEVARGLAILEAVAGQLYLGVMVARLVSLYVSGTAAKKQVGPEVR